MVVIAAALLNSMLGSKRKGTMPFPIPDVWQHDSVDIQREETKRKQSPSSFFFSIGQAPVLAAEYFVDERLSKDSRGGVAMKHRHRIHLALYGQLLASFEYLLKDFIAKVIDVTGVFDQKVQRAKWIEVDASKVLAYRIAASTPGSILIHPTMGWHYPDIVNQRYADLFNYQPIATAEIPTLERLWILRHSVAYNAGFVIHHDASRIGSASLAEAVAAIDASFISQTHDFLKPIAERLAAKVGDVVLLEWLRSMKPLGPSYVRDNIIYTQIKRLTFFVPSRVQDIQNTSEADYLADFARV
jgi:hypothetical protein